MHAATHIDTHTHTHTQRCTNAISRALPLLAPRRAYYEDPRVRDRVYLRSVCNVCARGGCVTQQPVGFPSRYAVSLRRPGFPPARSRAVNSERILGLLDLKSPRKFESPKMNNETHCREGTPGRVLETRAEISKTDEKSGNARELSRKYLNERIVTKGARFASWDVQRETFGCACKSITRKRNWWKIKRDKMRRNRVVDEGRRRASNTRGC